MDLPNKQTLEDLYKYHNKSIREIATFLNIKPWKIYQLLVEYGLNTYRRSSCNPFEKQCTVCNSILPREKFPVYKRKGDATYRRGKFNNCTSLSMFFYRATNKSKE